MVMTFPVARKLVQIYQINFIEDPLSASLTELRCALFFQKRADKYWGGYIDGQEENAKTIFKFIKERVRRGELE